MKVLTVRQSQCITISATVHRSPGLHQTAVRICRRELMEDSLEITMWDLIFLWWQLQPPQWAPFPRHETTYMHWVCAYVCFYLPCPSKMPWNLPPWGSSWSSRWLRCMSSGLLGPPPGAWSWWHQQGSPVKQPVYLQRRVTKDIMRRFHYAHTVSHSYIPTAASRRAGDGCMEWYDKSSVYTARVLWDSKRRQGGGQNPFLGEENVTQHVAVWMSADAELSRCLLPAMAPAVSSCTAPRLPSSSAIFALVWA